MKKISVIIPYYNGEKFIKKCVDSLLNQTYKNFEIIIINDGSKKTSNKKLNELLKDNKKVKVYSKKNEGVSIARNYGISKSSGDYITFVDQDDFVENDYLYNMITNMNNNDVLISGYNRYLEDYTLYQNNVPQITEWSKYKYMATWGKMYDINFIKNNKIYFEKSVGEDVIFLMTALSKTDKVKILDYAGYNNYRNVKSITRSKYKKKEDFQQMMDFMIKIEKLNTDKFDKKLLTYFYLKTSVLQIFISRHAYGIVKLYKEYKYYFKWLKEIYKKYNIKMKFNFQEGEEKKINLFVNVFLLFHKLHITIILLLMIKLINEQKIE